MKKIEKNGKKYKRKIKVKKKIWKEILKAVIAFIVGFVYLVYSIIKWINNLITKLFLKLPRLLRVGIIYTMIILSIFGIRKPKEIIKEVVKEEELKIIFRPGEKNKITETEEQIQKKEIIENVNIEKTCNLSQIECKIFNNAIEKGLTENQAFIILSISKHETGNWTSKAFLNKNNLGGIMCSTGLKNYDSLDEGIDAFVSLLKNRYFLQGLDTIEKIQPVYCPIGASNDPNNLNQYWLPMVTKYYQEYVK